MKEIIWFLIDLIPYIIVGFITFYATKVQCNKELRKATLDAYYEGKKDGRIEALQDYVKDGNKD